MFEPALRSSGISGPNPVRGLLASLVLHAAAIALLLLCASPVPVMIEQSLAPRRFTLLSPPLAISLRRAPLPPPPQPSARTAVEPRRWAPAPALEQPEPSLGQSLDVHTLPVIDPRLRVESIPLQPAAAPALPAVRRGSFAEAHIVSDEPSRPARAVQGTDFAAPDAPEGSPRAKLELALGSFSRATTVKDSSLGASARLTAGVGETTFGGPEDAGASRPAPGGRSVRLGVDFDAPGRAAISSRKATSVRETTFGESATARQTARRQPNAAPSGFNRGVEIVSKPHPEYTEEARRRRVEGEVVLEVLFTADGEVQVKRLVSGLGHGLDERAVEAASRICFLPARREGKAVDQVATVRIQFQLA